jgi:transposase-like protein
MAKSKDDDAGWDGSGLNSIWGKPKLCKACGSLGLVEKDRLVIGTTKGGVVKVQVRYRCERCNKEFNSVVGYNHGEKQADAGSDRLREGDDRGSEGEIEGIGGDTVSDS